MESAQMSAGRLVTIDFLPGCVERYRSGYAVVAIDVIRATTTLATGVAAGRRCYVAPTIDSALELASRLRQPLLAGEVGGNMPFGFDMTNSPAALALRRDIERPMVLVSSSGTQLIHNARACDAAYIACFRNYEAIAARVAECHDRAAIIGAGTRGEFREEDQMCCAWIAARLIDAGYTATDPRTQDIIARWKDAPAGACTVSKSVAYLTATRQHEDLDFVLSHVNDLEVVLALEGDEIVAPLPPLRTVEAANGLPASVHPAGGSAPAGTRAFNPVLP
jgi:2-phosphosulfolactate phosphatase